MILLVIILFFTRKLLRVWKIKKLIRNAISNGRKKGKKKSIITPDVVNGNSDSISIVGDQVTIKETK